jgi:uncharacterized protein YbgA (DUF1722 family)/uncharacterized protein YbbK (DUF523 family)
MQGKIKMGISACLLGEQVRFDGGHKLDRYIVNTLGQYFDFVPVCPEVECGLGIPRESMRLVGDAENPRLISNKTKIDHTERLSSWARERVRKLEREELCGFIFKKDSPSSGMERVRVYSEKGMPAKTGVGMFARVFMWHFPLLPVEDEGRLHDPKLRENFIEQVFALKRWREVLTKPPLLGHVVDFHTRHKLLVLSHSPIHHRQMGKLVAGGKALSVQELYLQYEKLLMEALKLKTTLRKNVNVLHHVMGYFKKDLSKDEKQELVEIIQHYREGLVPLIVPITLINHYVRKYQQPYLQQQTYLNPHPIALRLRTHV